MLDHNTVRLLSTFPVIELLLPSVVVVVVVVDNNDDGKEEMSDDDWVVGFVKLKNGKA